jgi:hypothetical protein
MAEIYSRRTCGITASFTYPMAWRSSISISSIASSMRCPKLPGGVPQREPGGGPGGGGVVLMAGIQSG